MMHEDATATVCLLSETRSALFWHLAQKLRRQRSSVWLVPGSTGLICQTKTGRSGNTELDQSLHQVWCLDSWCALKFPEMENGLRKTCGRDSKSWEINRFFRETSSELWVRKAKFLGHTIELFAPSFVLISLQSPWEVIHKWFFDTEIQNQVAWFQPAATDAIRPSKQILNAIMLKWFLEWTWLSKTSQGSSWMQKLHLLRQFQHILDHDHHQASSNSHGSLAGNQ